MRRRTPRIVLELGRRRLRAVEAAVSGSALHVLRVVDTDIPTDLPLDHPPAVGAWLATTLDAAGFPRSPVLLALSRDAVVARRVVLPTTDAAEIPEMARLAMVRELPLDGGDAAIDYTELSRDATGTSVFGVASLQRTIDWLNACSTLAGRPPMAASPRMLGTAALVEACGAAASALLVVDVTGDGVEMLVVGGQPGIGFSRGAPLRPDGESGSSLEAHPAQPREVRATVDAVIAEVKRSWLGHRMASGSDGAAGSGDVRSLAVIAEPALREATQSALSAALGLVEGRIDAAAVIRSSTELRACAPLAGLLLDNCPHIDLLHPRKAPDLAARRRQMALASIGLLVLAGLLGFTLGRSEARATDSRRDEIAQKARGALAEGWRLRRDEDKLRHVAQWTEPSENWLQDFIYVKELLPEPGDVVLDTVAASQEFSGVKLEKPASTRQPGGAAPEPRAEASVPAAGDAARQPRWASSTEVRIVLEGEAKTRAIADALREKLIADSRFSVTTSGSDTRGGNRLPYPFGYLLRSQRAADPVSVMKP